MKLFHAGAIFGRLTLRQKVRESPKVSPTIRRQWVCDCECGVRVTVPEYYLIRKPNPKVNCGQCLDLKTTKTLYNEEYRIWLMMLRRTSDPRHRSFKDYGGRGINVCPEWSDLVSGFDAFLTHIGPRPSERHSVDRINNDDGYKPGNVRWATPDQQAANQRPRKPRAKSSETSTPPAPSTTGTALSPDTNLNAPAEQTNSERSSTNPS